MQYQECDGSQCDAGKLGTWTFRGASGDARWPSGARASLTLETTDEGSITVHRVDVAGSASAGFTAVYHGTLHNGRYEGTVDASWPGHFPQAGVHYAWWAAVVTGQSQPSASSASPSQPSGPTASSGSVTQGPSSVLQGPLKLVAILDAPAPFAATSSLPKQMRFCGVICFKLALVNDHYEATQEPSSDGSVVSSIYTVVRFSPQAIELYRNESNHQFGILTGRMSSDGDQLIDGSIVWYQPDGSSNAFAHVTLSWGAALMEARAWTPPAAESAAAPAAPPKHALTPPDPTHPDSPTGTIMGDYFYNQVEQMRARPVPVEIDITPEESPFYKSYPDDIRAVLQPEFRLAPGLHELPCDSKLDISGEEALEIGRYALRAAEFLRGRCWLERGARTKNVRANEVLALAYLMGWGVKQNQQVGFQWFLNIWKSSKDLWAYHFLAQCLRFGVGTSVDTYTAARLDQALIADPRGQDLIMKIGADDAEQRREFARLNLMMSPPTRSHQVCEHLPTPGLSTCRDQADFDQDEFNRQMQEINSSH